MWVVPISNLTGAKEPRARLSQMLMMEDSFNWVSKIAVKGNNGNAMKMWSLESLSSAYSSKFDSGLIFQMLFQIFPNTIISDYIQC